MFKQNITRITNIIKDDNGNYGIWHSFFLWWLVWFLFIYSLRSLKRGFAVCRSFCKDVKCLDLLIFTMESHVLDSALLMLSISFWKKLQLYSWRGTYVLLYLLYHRSFLVSSESIIMQQLKSSALKCQHDHKEQNQQWILRKGNPVAVHL